MNIHGARAGVSLVCQAAGFVREKASDYIIIFWKGSYLHEQ
jgi:hypothetical protein